MGRGRAGDGEYGERDEEAAAVRPPPAGDGAPETAVLAGCGRATNGLAAGLATAGLRVLTYDAYGPALRELPGHRPAVIVAGQAPGSGDLFRFLPLAGRSHPRAVLLCLVDRPEAHLVSRVLERGAHDVVGPPHSVSSILLRLEVCRRRIREGAGRTSTLSHQVSLGRITVDLTTRQVLDDGRPLSLSGREFELLVRLMEAGGGVVTRERLLEDIWGPDQGSDAVLDAAVHRLRRRLDEDPRDPDLVVTIRGIGYRLDAWSMEPERTAAD